MASDSCAASTAVGASASCASVAQAASVSRLPSVGNATTAPAPMPSREASARIACRSRVW